MQSDSAPSPQLESIPIRNGILTLYGYGLTIYIEHGRLSVEDGIANRTSKERLLEGHLRHSATRDPGP